LPAFFLVFPLSRVPWLGWWSFCLCQGSLLSHHKLSSTNSTPPPLSLGGGVGGAFYQRPVLTWECDGWPPLFGPLDRLVITIFFCPGQMRVLFLRLDQENVRGRYFFFLEPFSVFLPVGAGKKRFLLHTHRYLSISLPPFSIAISPFFSDSPGSLGLSLLPPVLVLLIRFQAGWVSALSLPAGTFWRTPPPPP